MIGSLALLAAVIFMLWPANPSDTAGVDGETVGWVSKVDSNMIHVSSGPFGGGVVPLQVTRGTRITIGAKEAWFEDIRPGGQVKVVYQTVNGNRIARSVELLVEEGPKRPIARVKSATGADQAPRPAVTSNPGRAEPKPVDAVSKSPALTPPAPAPTEHSPAARVERPHAQATDPGAHRNDPPGRRAISESGGNGGRSAEPARPQPPAATPPPTRSAETPRPGDADATDGAAAVDWLLKNRR
jgi:hypothetical protein